MRVHEFAGKTNKDAGRSNRIVSMLRSAVAMVGLALCLAVLPARSLADSIIPGDIYLYTSGGGYVDVTAEFHEDPIIIFNGSYILVVPDYLNGVVYDALGDTIGFIGATGD